MSVWENVTTAFRIQIPEYSFLEDKSVDVGCTAYLGGHRRPPPSRDGVFTKDYVRLQKHLARAVIDCTCPIRILICIGFIRQLQFPTIDVPNWE